MSRLLSAHGRPTLGSLRRANLTRRPHPC